MTNAVLTNELTDTILSNEHRMLRDETRKFAANEVLPEVRERDHKRRHMSEDLMDQFAQMGFFRRPHR